jgi:hypothetical protein
VLLALLGGLSPQEEALPLDLRALIPPSARFVRKAIPTAQNAYPELLKLQNRRSPGSREYFDDVPRYGVGVKPKAPSPRQVLAQTQADAQALARAMARPGFQWPKPVISDWFEVPDAPPSHGTSTLVTGTFSRLCVRRASAFSTLKQVDRAIGELEILGKLGRGIGSGNPLAIQYLFAGMVDRMLAQSVQELVKAHRLSKGQIARLRRAVGPAQTVDPDLALTAKVELNEFTLEEYQRVPLEALLKLDPLLMFSDIPGAESEVTIEDVWPVDDPDLLDRRTTFSLLAQATARALPDLGRPWPLRDRKPDEFLARHTELVPERPWEEEEREPRKDELAAFRRAAERIPNAFGLFKLKDKGLFDLREVALQRLTYRALALGALAVEEGSRKLPLDPASLKPIRFDPKTRTLYGIGSNEKDERGRGDDVRMTL